MKYLVLAVALFGCGSDGDSGCESPLSGGYEIAFVDSTMGLTAEQCYFEQSSGFGSVSSFCDGCDGTLQVGSTGSLVATGATRPVEGNPLDFSSVSSGRWQIEGACMGGAFVGTGSLYLPTQCTDASAGVPGPWCSGDAFCVFDVEIGR